MSINIAYHLTANGVPVVVTSGVLVSSKDKPYAYFKVRQHREEVTIYCEDIQQIDALLKGLTELREDALTCFPRHSAEREHNE